MRTPKTVLKKVLVGLVLFSLGALAAYLAPRGALWVGNMVPTSPNRWFMEMHLDWFLIYRTRAEMMDMARLAAPDARVHIQDEPTGINPFVVLTRE